MRCGPQLVATHGNGFCLSEPPRRRSIAADC
jgi:hypothetical protein